MGQSHPEQSYEHQMVCLSRALKSLRHSDDAGAAITLTIDHIHREFGFDLVWIGIYDPEHHRLTTQGWQSGSSMHSMRTTFNLTPGDVMEQVVVQQRSLVVADLQNESKAGEWRGVAQQLSLQSAVMFPMRHHTQCLGVVVMGSQQWGLSPTLGEQSHLSMLLGGLAEALHKFQAEEQRQKAKRPDRPLLALLAKLGATATVDDQLKAVVQETQRFIQPSRTRLFWLEPEGNYFWQRMPPVATHSSKDSETGTTADQIAIEDVRSFYQSLCHDQVTAVGEVRGSLNATVTERLMQILKAQSLMVAPILNQGELLGFIAVEDHQPRLWLEAEKQFLRGVSQLVGLALPASTAQETVAQIQLDQQLTSGVVQGIHSDLDWRRTLQTCAGLLLQRLRVQQFFVLLFDPNRGGYDLCFQRQAGRSRPVAPIWPCLDDVDWQMLERSPSAVAVEDMRQDLKLMAWRSHLQGMGVNAVLACNTSPGNAPEGIILVTHAGSRHWTSDECTLLEAVSRQIGVILHQWQLQRQMDQQERIHESIQWGLRALQRSFNLTQLEQITVDQIAALLQVPAVALVTWAPGAVSARVSESMVPDQDIILATDYDIPVKVDAILNWALQTEGILPIAMADVPSESQFWLSAPGDSKLLVVALRTAPEHLVTGVLVVLGYAHRQWSDYHLDVLSLLASQLAWSRRHLELVTMLTDQRDELEQLNWYKNHQLAELQRLLGNATQRLSSLEADTSSLATERFKGSLKQLHGLVEGLQPLLEHERWQLGNEFQTIPLVSLLNRLMERGNPLIQSQQLWAKVHSETNAIIGGNIAKIEYVLYELLAAACLRSPPGARIDIWCRPMDNRHWLEFSITDNGDISTETLTELQRGRPMDWLAPSSLDVPPGLHLAICQSLMRQMGSNLAITQLDDRRIHSRLLLAVVSGSQRSALHGDTGDVGTPESEDGENL